MIEFHGLGIIESHLFPGATILELGNQIMNLEHNQGQSAKDYFTERGYKHISIDQNGLNGALPLDLSKPVDLDVEPDLITDIGTSEHVSDLYECLCNVLKWTKPGTVMIHKNPLTGHFPNHGFHFYTTAFWEKWAEATGLELLSVEEYPIYHNTETGFEVIAVLQALKATRTPSREDFDEIANGTIFSE